MTSKHDESIRATAAIGIIGALLTAVLGAIIQLIVQPSTNISDEMWSYPLSSRALVPMSVLYAAIHVLVIVGIVGVQRSGMAGPTKAARRGLTTAVAGTVFLLVGELASIPIRGDRVEDTGAAIVGGIFGLGIGLSAIGLLTAGWASRTTGHWTQWRRYSLLSAGAASAAILPLQFAHALSAGVGLYGLGLLAITVALYTQPSSTNTSTPDLLRTA
jgi:hypothetical protein